MGSGTFDDSDDDSNDDEGVNVEVGLNVILLLAAENE